MKRLVRARAALISVLSIGVASATLAACSPDDKFHLPGLTPGTHAQFPIVEGTPHALGLAAADGPISCASCHVDESSFKPFECIGCHEHRQTGRDPDGSEGMDAIHTGLMDYGYESTRCYSCHENGLAAELSRAEHTEFPIDTGSRHGALRCNECHTSPDTREVVTCTGCHRDSDGDGRNDHDLAPMLDAHGPEMSAFGYEWTTAKCLDCHAQSENPGQIVHEPFPVAAGEVHEGVSCADCHASVADRSELTCTGCHEQVNDGNGLRDVHGEARMFERHANGSVPGYEYASRTCYSCHQQSEVPGVFDHASFFPIDAASVHPLGVAIDDDPNDSFAPVTVECTSCHQSQSYAEVTCTSCHAHTQPLMDPVHAGFPDYGFDSVSCVFCHKGGTRLFEHGAVASFPVSSMTDTHALDDPGTPVLDGLSCGDCHASQTNRHEMRCASCHDHSQPTELLHHGAELATFGYVWESNACLACHATSQVPGLIDHEPIYPLLPPSGNGAHEALACADCHASREDRSGSLSCTACHQPTSSTDAREVHGEPRLGEVHNGLPEYIWAPQSCIGCHTDGTAATASRNLNHTWFPVDTGATHALASKGGTLACVDCHSTPGDFTRATIGCITCHQQKDDGNGPRDVHGEPRMSDIHTGVDGFVFQSSICLECHPNGEPTGQFDHTGFPIATGSKHEAVTCTECHDASAPKSDQTALQCRQCHEGTVNLNPTVLQIHDGIPDFVNASASCYGCHTNANPSPPFDHDPFFPISAGNAHDAMSCADCHTDPTRRSTVTCTGCHTDTNADGLFDHDVTAMLTAHGPDMARLGYQWSTTACRTCHARAENPGLLDHEAAFPVATGTVHAGMRCADCHASKQDRSQLSCVSCHTQVDDGTGPRDVHGEPRMFERHANGTVPGYGFDSVACYGCHQQAQVPGVMDHERFFPIGAGSAHPLGSTIDTPGVLVECATCHQNPSNQSQVTCTSCHAHEQAVLQPTHGLFPDYTYASSSCVFCHLGGTRRFDHTQVTAFPVSTPGDSHLLDDPATPAVDGLSCGECHASQTDRTLLACTTCHQHTVAQSDLDHGTAMSRYGYRYDAQACYQCHQTSQVPGLFDHEPIYPLLPPSGRQAHQALSCVDCHASKTDRAGSLTCTACHQPAGGGDNRDVHGQPRMDEVHSSIPGYAWSPRVCIGCHTDGTAASGATNLNHIWFPISAGNTHAVTTTGGQLSCTDCHTTQGTYTAFECVTCHLEVTDPGNAARPVHGQARSDEIHAAVNGYVFSSLECYTCHPDGNPVGNFDHTGFPIATGATHAGIGCTECHTGNAPKTDVSALACASCHATVNTAPETIDVIHNGVPGFANDSPSCYSCHPNAEPVGPMEHSAFFPIAPGSEHGSASYLAKVGGGQTSCSACHASRADRTQALCSTCHATVSPTPASAHGNVGGFANNSTSCKRCHADAQVHPVSSHLPFRIQPNTKHHRESCLRCHTSRRTDKPWAQDFNQYGCVSCHSVNSMNDKHRGEVNGYISYDVPRCTTCHGDGRKP